MNRFLNNPDTAHCADTTARSYALYGETVRYNSELSLYGERLRYLKPKTTKALPLFHPCGSEDRASVIRISKHMLHVHNFVIQVSTMFIIIAQFPDKVKLLIGEIRMLQEKFPAYASETHFFAINENASKALFAIALFWPITAVGLCSNGLRVRQPERRNPTWILRRFPRR